jgi:hypothetical protein
VIVPKLLQRIRGAIGMGVIWALAWGAVGGVPRWVFGVYTDAPLGLVFAVFGFIAGVTFSALLVLMEGRRRFDEMSIPRFALWGGMGGLLLSSVMVRLAGSWAEVIAIPTTFAVACAVCASGTLALARRAATRELPAGRGDARDLPSPRV